MLQAIFGVAAYAQPGTVQLRPEKIPLKASEHFYILDVLDQRPGKGSHLGTVFQNTQAYPLSFDGSTESRIYNLWRPSLRQPTDAMIPVVATITELSVKEKRQAPGRINGVAGITVTFSWKRDDADVPLTTFKTRGEYTRPENPAYNYAGMIKKMATDALVYLDRWMALNHGKNPALVRGVRLVFVDTPIADRADTVFYRPGRKLVYSDFKAAPRPGRYAAMVFTSIAYEGNSRVRDNYVEVEIRLKVFMVKSMSWIRPESKNSNVLRHEQLHFDIARIIAERFRRRLTEHEASLSVEDHDSQIQYHFLEIFREMNRLQEKYDSETRHGLNAAEQAEWDRYVTGELAAIQSASTE